MVLKDVVFLSLISGFVFTGVRWVGGGGKVIFLKGIKERWR